MDQVADISSTSADRSSDSGLTEVYRDPFCHVCLAQLPDIEPATDASIGISENILVCFCPTCQSPSHLCCYLGRTPSIEELPSLVIQLCCDCA